MYQLCDQYLFQNIRFFEADGLYFLLVNRFNFKLCSPSLLVNLFQDYIL